MLISLSDGINRTELSQVAIYKLAGTLERVRIAIEDLRAQGPSDTLDDLDDRQAQRQASMRALEKTQRIQEQDLRAMLQAVASARDEEG